MNIQQMWKIAEKYVVDNAPKMMTSFGVVGVISTSVLAARGGLKAHQILLEADAHRVAEARSNQEEAPELTRKEIVLLTWKCYAPAVGMGALTIGSIFFSHRIGSRRAAGLAAAYSLSERAFSEYREKIVEKLGPKKEQSARDEVAQDRVNRNPISQTQKEMIFLGKKNGEILCFDKFGGRYFMTSVEEINKAVNEVNHLVIHNDQARLTDFYHRIGLPETTYSEEVGWDTDNLLEVEMSTTLSDEDTPCLVISYNAKPIRGSKHW